MTHLEASVQQDLEEIREKVVEMGDLAEKAVHASNLPATCGHCHPGAGKRFALGPIHVVEGRTEPPAVLWARWFYLAAIPVLVGGMLLHNAGDWVRKVIRPRRVRAPEAAPEIRMFGWERIQHALLAVSFAVLVWTGFALKYPDQWWARPLLVWEGSAEARGTIHRIASVVFILTAVLHIISLAASRRLRQHWELLWPRRADLPQGWQAFAYNLGWRRQPPRLSCHSYVEKVEYWAVVWGAVIMSASGVLLWADNFFLARLPKAFMDVATVVHFYEAILATLAIVVWHFYFVIFDPDVYPMDTAWLTGRSPRPRHHAGDSGESA
jgi:cytochrome b subunit of formate dehydrogenase